MQSKAILVQEYFDNPERWLKNNPAITVRSQIVRELVPDVTNCSILDVGCGDGSISAQFLAEGNHVTMVDVSPRMLEKAREKNGPNNPGITYRNVDLANLETDDKFDLILCIGVLAHVENVQHAINKMSDLLNTGGRCVIQITDSEKLLGKLLWAYYRAYKWFSPALEHSLNRSGVSQLTSLAAVHGLKLLGMRRHSFLLPGMGRLPMTWLLRYELFVLNNRLLSKCGTSAMLLFEK